MSDQPVLITARAVFHHPHVLEAMVSFDGDADHWQQRFTVQLTRELWEDMGCPEVITGILTHGNALDEQQVHPDPVVGMAMVLGPCVRCGVEATNGSAIGPLCDEHAAEYRAEYEPVGRMTPVD